MTSGTVSSLFFVLLSCSSVLAQQQAQFNQVLNIGGDMQLNSFQFQDGSKVETFSQKQQQLIVNQQTPSVAANQVTGTTGNPFIALQQNSMVISTNGAKDLVGGQIEMTMSAQALQQAQIQPDNTYVAMLSPDRQTWMIQESIRSINTTDMTVRMVKLQSIDGEYMMIGRQTSGTETQLTPFGSGQAAKVSITGSGLQENEFTDGFRMSVKATQPMTMTVDVKKGLDSSMLTALQGQQSVNDYRYSVTTSLAGVQPNLNQQVTVIQMPLNIQRIQTMMKAAGIQPGGQVALGVAQRTVLANPGGASANIGAPGATLQKRGRNAFRATIAKRQTPQVDQSGQLQQGQTGQAQQGQTGQINPTQQGQAGQIDPTQQGQTGQIDPTQQGQTGQNDPTQQGQQQGQTGQIDPTQQGQIGQIDPNQQQGQTPQGTGQQQGTGQTQQGTPTNGNNPVATQLLLAPTFTPIQANVVLDPVNMRVAFPVSQLDGEYILTMQMGGAQAAPAAAPAAEGAKPAGASKPAAANGTAPAEPKVKRQDASTEASPAKGQVYITMREVNRLVDMQSWGMQAPISQMMTEFVKGSNGTATA